MNNDRSTASRTAGPRIATAAALLGATSGLLAAQVTPERPPLPEDTLSKVWQLVGQPPRLPLGLRRMSPTPSNPITTFSAGLGRKLFFDPILSVDRTVSCASCHQPDHGLASPQARPLGVHGQRTINTAPSLYNRGLGVAQGWNGSTNSLEQRVAQSIQHPVEMGLPLVEAAARLHEHKEYRVAFDRIYVEGPTELNLARAVATFIRSQVKGNSPVDAFQIGRHNALTPEEKAGLWVFEGKGRCWHCHRGSNFTDEQFHNTGVGISIRFPEDGRMAVTRRENDRGRFKTPTLRGLVDTAPYMHDGSLETLDDVLDFYAAGGNANVNLDWRMQPVQFTGNDRANLMAFLKALSREREN